MKVIIVVVLVLLFLAPPIISQVPDDKLIVPGQRVGKWTLALTVQEIVGELGRPPRPASVPAPRQGGQLGADLQVDLRAYNWERVGLIVYTMDDRSILLVEADDAPDFATEKGVKWDMLRADVESAYGRPTRVTQWGRNPAQVTLQYNEIGLEVGFTTTGRVAFIGVFRPGNASSIWKP